MPLSSMQVRQAFRKILKPNPSIQISKMFSLSSQFENFYPNLAPLIFPCATVVLLMLSNFKLCSFQSIPLQLLVGRCFNVL